MMVSVSVDDYYMVVDTTGRYVVVIVGINLVVFCELTKNIYGFFLCFTTLILPVRFGMTRNVLIYALLSDTFDI